MSRIKFIVLYKGTLCHMHGSKVDETCNHKRIKSQGTDQCESYRLKEVFVFVCSYIVFWVGDVVFTGLLAGGTLCMRRKFV